jgi:hypothetical protein
VPEKSEKGATTSGSTAGSDVLAARAGGAGGQLDAGGVGGVGGAAVGRAQSGPTAGIRAVRFAEVSMDGEGGPAGEPPRFVVMGGGLAARANARLVFKSWDDSVQGSAGISGPSYEPSASTWRGPQVRSLPRAPVAAVLCSLRARPCPQPANQLTNQSTDQST